MFFKGNNDVIIILMGVTCFVWNLKPSGNAHCHSSKSIFILTRNAVHSGVFILKGQDRHRGQSGRETNIWISWKCEIIKS